MAEELDYQLEAEAPADASPTAFRDDPDFVVPDVRRSTAST